MLLFVVTFTLAYIVFQLKKSLIIQNFCVGK